VNVGEIKAILHLSTNGQEAFDFGLVSDKNHGEALAIISIVVTDATKIITVIMMVECGPNLVICQIICLLVIWLLIYKLSDHLIEYL
jgi:hypothetical protein